MEFLLDTNILLAYVRQAPVVEQIDTDFAPLGPDKSPVISVVSVGEIKSLAIRNKWGDRKQQILDNLLNQFLIADINVKSVIDRYATIDTFRATLFFTVG